MAPICSLEHPGAAALPKSSISIACDRHQGVLWGSAASSEEQVPNVHATAKSLAVAAAATVIRGYHHCSPAIFQTLAPPPPPPLLPRQHLLLSQGDHEGQSRAHERRSAPAPSSMTTAASFAHWRASKPSYRKSPFDRGGCGWSSNSCSTCLLPAPTSLSTVVLLAFLPPLPSLFRGSYSPRSSYRRFCPHHYRCLERRRHCHGH